MKYISKQILTGHKNDVLLIIPSLTAYLQMDMWSMRFVHINRLTETLSFA